MSENMNCLLIVYNDMRLGGIQQIIYDNVRSYLNAGWKVIWLAPKKYDIDGTYYELMNDNVICIADYNGTIQQLRCSDAEYNLSIQAISFDINGFLTLCKLEKELGILNYKYFLIVPNVLGSGVRIDLDGDTNAYEIMKAFYQKLLWNGNLLFCNKTQFEALVDFYNLENSGVAGLLIMTQREIPQIDMEIIRKRFKCNEIITVTRFDFPHKGYVLGLIDAFPQIKAQHPEMVLRIIGYGNDETVVKKKISQQPKDVRNSIFLEGPISHDKLKVYFDKSKLFVGVAGALHDAVVNGLVSIIARHYCEDCEVYGLYQDCSDKVICLESGEDIINIVNDVLALDEEQYVQASAEGYEKFKQVTRESQSQALINIEQRDRCVFEEEELFKIELICQSYLKRSKKNRNLSYLKNPLFNAQRLIKRYFDW